MEKALITEFESLQDAIYALPFDAAGDQIAALAAFEAAHPDVRGFVEASEVVS